MEVSGEAIVSGKDDEDHNPDSNFSDSSDKKAVDPHKIDTFPIKGEEEQLDALRNCLPAWVTRDQMLELISCSGGNIVESVNNFYEREIEFHQQVAASASSSAAIVPLDCLVDTSSFSTQDASKDIAWGNVEHSPVKDYRSLQKVLSSKNSKSPAKTARKTRNSGSGPRKKLKSSGKWDAIGVGQSKITRFFNKPLAGSSHPAGHGSSDEASSQKEKTSRYSDY